MDKEICKGTPKKAVKRDVKGLLSMQLDSPSQSDVIWNSVDSPYKTRAVGGKSKFLKSSNQLTPRNMDNKKKKYYSSPVLVARISDDGKKDDANDERNSENRRVLEEFQKEFNENYRPRNLLDNLCESLEDSIIIPDAEINNKNIIKEDQDDELIDQEELDIIKEIEEQERRLLEVTPKDSRCKATILMDTQDLAQMSTSSMSPASSSNKNINPIVASSSIKKPTEKVNYFESDDDDDIILSIPIEALTGESSKKPINNNPQQKYNNINNNKNSDRSSHTSVIPVKREHFKVNNGDINRIQNQSNPKPVAHSNTGANNAEEPLAKRICTSDEIAEKKRQAMLRRENYLRSLKAKIV